MSTHLPPPPNSHPDHDAARSTLSQSATWQPDPSRPLSRGERTGWNTVTALVGGVCALSLLLGGAGAAAAGVLAQERAGTWTAKEDIKTVDISSDLAYVSVLTSPTVDHVEVEWHQSGWNIGDGPKITTSGGKLRIATADGPSLGRAKGSNSLTVTIPEKKPKTDLVANTSWGVLNVRGTFDTVSAATTTGVVNVSETSARTLAARSEQGVVAFDRVRASDTLDAHTSTGALEISVVGPAPKKSSITTLHGGYSLSFPTADYWYPEGSTTNVGSPRTPNTTMLTSPDEAVYEDPSSTPIPGEIRGLLPDSETDAAIRCEKAPKGRPCLFLVGEPMPGGFGYSPETWSEDVSADELADEATDEPATPRGTPTATPSGRSNR